MLTTTRSSSDSSLSIIICTRDRAERLPKQFDALSMLDVAGLSVEIIFVNNASRDATDAVLTAQSLRLNCPYQILSEPQPGVSRAKNTGAAAATGGYLAFTDDDCYPSPDWARRIIEFFDNNPHVPAVAGYVSLYDPADAPFTITEGAVPPRINASSLQFASVHGCNIAVTAQCFHAAGGFDVCLGPGTVTKACEDRDFLYRAIRLSGPMYYDATIRVAHHHGRKAADALQLAHDYELGEESYIYKYLARLDINALRWLVGHSKRRVAGWKVFSPARPLYAAKAAVGTIHRGGRAYRAAQRSL